MIVAAPDPIHLIHRQCSSGPLPALDAPRVISKGVDENFSKGMPAFVQGKQILQPLHRKPNPTSGAAAKQMPLPGILLAPAAGTAAPGTSSQQRPRAAHHKTRRTVLPDIAAATVRGQLAPTDCAATAAGSVFTKFAPICGDFNLTPQEFNRYLMSISNQEGKPEISHTVHITEGYSYINTDRLIDNLVTFKPNPKVNSLSTSPTTSEKLPDAQILCSYHKSTPPQHLVAMWATASDHLPLSFSLINQLVLHNWHHLI